MASPSEQSKERPFLGWPVTVALGVAVVGFATWNVLREMRGAKARGAMRETCMENLREIDARKKEWFAATGATANHAPSLTNLFGGGVLKRGPFPACPMSGVYNPGRATEKPWCTAPGHTL